MNRFSWIHFDTVLACGVLKMLARWGRIPTRTCSVHNETGDTLPEEFACWQTIQPYLGARVMFSSDWKQQCCKCMLHARTRRHVIFAYDDLDLDTSTIIDWRKHIDTYCQRPKFCTQNMILNLKFHLVLSVVWMASLAAVYNFEMIKGEHILHLRQGKVAFLWKYVSSTLFERRRYFLFQFLHQGSLGHALQAECGALQMYRGTTVNAATCPSSSACDRSGLKRNVLGLRALCRSSMSILSGGFSGVAHWDQILIAVDYCSGRFRRLECGFHAMPFSSTPLPSQYQ